MEVTVTNEQDTGGRVQLHVRIHQDDFERLQGVARDFGVRPKEVIALTIRSLVSDYRECGEQLFDRRHQHVAHSVAHEGRASTPGKRLYD